ncbi:hypothetical protein JOD57_000287 [Geodermatophilus bullaregiensis]|uniref:hypothetical protein n=1 Tax=Geodermatophilus bullaregiensis TaxID=1564160 RepID=UPI0019597404|nr:hypothetical protein [Geodermatophilus bullaregiensis]MBM7804450.1 hypothetical protein [Geodermatophilus bullaregiensis]
MTQPEQLHVEEQPPASADVTAALVPATVVGMPPTAQTFFAVVEANGSLTRGFHAVSSQRLFAGGYEVVFSHDVTGSAYVATTGFTAPFVPPGGGIALAPRAGIPNGVFVTTRDDAGNFADRAFYLAVHS